MHIQLIRNATLRLHYAGRTLLTDPALDPKHARPTLAGRSPNPTVDLPLPAEDVVRGAEAALITHLHRDHFDDTAARLLPADLPLLCQPEAADRLRGLGFTTVIPVDGAIEWEGIAVTRTPGEHGRGAWAEQLNPVCGFVLRAAGEPCVYWCGDTIWYEAAGEVIRRERPDVILTHSGGAELEDSGPIVMDAAQTVALCRAAPDARVVAIHLEALDHCLVARADLRAFADRYGIEPRQLLIPADGETLAF